MSEKQPDPINHPLHYTSHKSGVECIQITEHMSFLRGNAMKYMWRADHKNGLEDLKKSRWYLDREIANLEQSLSKQDQQSAVADTVNRALHAASRLAPPAAAPELEPDVIGRVREELTEILERPGVLKPSSYYRQTIHEALRLLGSRP